jgi:hypothetical protein
VHRKNLNQKNWKNNDRGDEYNGINRRLIADGFEPDRMINENIIAKARRAATLGHTFGMLSTKNGKHDLGPDDYDKIKGDMPGQKFFEIG